MSSSPLRELHYIVGREVGTVLQMHLPSLVNNRDAAVRYSLPSGCLCICAALPLFLAGLADHANQQEEVAQRCAEGLPDANAGTTHASPFYVLVLSAPHARPTGNTRPIRRQPCRPVPIQALPRSPPNAHCTRTIPPTLPTDLSLRPFPSSSPLHDENIIVRQPPTWLNSSSISRVIGFALVLAVRSFSSTNISNFHSVS